MMSSWPSVFGSLPVPSREDDDGVEAMSLDERIGKLQAGSRCMFRLKAHAVAKPSGIPNPKVDGWD